MLIQLISVETGWTRTAELIGGMFSSVELFVAAWRGWTSGGIRLFEDEL